MVPNSCATHALVSIMLNLPKDNLGPTLTKLKEHVEGIEDSETKGWAIGNCPELAQVCFEKLDCFKEGNFPLLNSGGSY
jgi:hypothetical protein